MGYREDVESGLELKKGDAIGICYRSMPMMPTQQGMIRPALNCVFEQFINDSIVYWTEQGGLCIDPLDGVLISKPPAGAAKRIVANLEINKDGDTQRRVVTPDMGPGLAGR